MPIRPFKEIPRTLVEWGRFFQQTEVTPTDGTVGEDQIADGEVTYQKIQNVTPNRLLGRDTSPAGEIQELTVTDGLEFTGTGIRRSQLLGDVTAAAGSNTTAFRDFAAVSVLGRATNTGGAPGDIAAASNGHYLRRSGDALAFAAIADADIPSTIARDSEVTTAINSAIGLLNLASGVYTPTVTGVTNVDSATAHECQYLRVGTTVHVSGRVDINTTAAAATQVRMTLPIASNIGVAADCGGVAYTSDVVMGAAIQGDPTNDAALFIYLAIDTASHDFFFSFSYQVI